MYKYLTYLLILIISMNGYTDFKNLGPDDVLTTPLPLPYNEKVVKASSLITLLIHLFKKVSSQ